jgi:hypothetical protein
MAGREMQRMAWVISGAVSEATFRGEFSKGTLELRTRDNDGTRRTYRLIEQNRKYQWEELGTAGTVASDQPHATQPGR